MQPHFQKEDPNVVKKNNIMRKKLLYNTSNNSLEKIAEESLPFRILLAKFLREGKDQIVNRTS